LLRACRRRLPPLGGCLPGGPSFVCCWGIQSGHEMQTSTPVTASLASRTVLLVVVPPLARLLGVHVPSLLWTCPWRRRPHRPQQPNLRIGLEVRENGSGASIEEVEQLWSVRGGLVGMEVAFSSWGVYSSTVDGSTVPADSSLVFGRFIRKVQGDLSAMSQGGFGGLGVDPHCGTRTGSWQWWDCP
jgi:hypothetical protein